jgi:hypothetical protein
LAVAVVADMGNLSGVERQAIVDSSIPERIDLLYGEGSGGGGGGEPEGADYR